MLSELLDTDNQGSGTHEHGNCDDGVDALDPLSADTAAATTAFDVDGCLAMLHNTCLRDDADIDADDDTNDVDDGGGDHHEAAAALSRVVHLDAVRDDR